MKNFYYLKTEPYNFDNMSSVFFETDHLSDNNPHPFRSLESDKIPSYFHLFFSNHGLLEKNEVIRANWFRLRPHSVGPIHLDGVPPRHDTWGLNWFIHWENTYMEWFLTKTQGDWYKTFSDKSGGIKWEDNDVDLVESLELNRPCFVKIDQPHRMISKSNTWRFCMSVRISKIYHRTDAGLELANTITKEEMFNRLKDKNLLEL